MKIHGTAKGGALSTKDFGVAFSSAGAGGGINDTGLKCLYSFGEASGDIINQSESDVNLGASANLQVDGATYSQTGIVTDALKFDGINDSAVAGTSLSNFKFLHDGTTDWSINFWALMGSWGDGDWFIDTSDGRSTQVGYQLGTNGAASSAGVTQSIAAGTGDGTFVFQNAVGAPFLPDTTNFHMYTYVYDSTTNEIELFKDGVSDTILSGATATPSTANSTFPLTLCKEARRTVGYLPITYCQMSFWSTKLIIDDRIAALYNNGSGAAIY